MNNDFDWVFFDCFNTLIDDFDDSGDESGLGSLPDMAVAGGFFADREEFLACYRHVRSESVNVGRELLLDERLTRTLAMSTKVLSPSLVASEVVRLRQHWETEYRRIIRPTPGIAETVAHWAQHKKLGVISNFFLPHYPARYLQDFGLAHHFRFILDSAAFGYKKPNPAIFTEAFRLAEMSQTQAHRIIFVGDRLDLDVFPARDFGMQTLHFNRMKTRHGVGETPPDIRRIYHWAEFR